MANMTLSMPDEISAEMKRFPEIKWSEVARQAILDRIERLEAIEKIAMKSKLTKKDIDEFDKLIKREATRKALAN